jgi:proline iminopeptidase
MGLQEDGQIIKEAAKLAHLPVTIVQGRYDLVCPMKTGTHHLHWSIGARQLAGAR